MSNPSASASTSDPKPEGSFSSRAPKGKACLACRRRKMKCDCVRPVCGQCVRFNRERDCEFTDGDQRSRTQILEENIAVLQARLRVLEHPDADPSTSLSLLQGNRESRSLTGHFDDAMDLSPEGDLTTSMSLPSQVYTRPNSQFSFNVTEPPLAVAQGLIEAFMAHSNDFGFFLNKQRFINYCTRKFSSSTHNAPADFLLSAVFLWGSHFAQDDRWPVVEETYATHCAELAAAAQTSGAINPIHVIQAEILLANYYLYSARFNEARKHISICVSLVLTHRLGKMRGQLNTGAESRLYLVKMDHAGPSEDLVDEGERIYAFWTVYTLDKMWALALDRQSFIADDGSPISTIETPWPLAMEEFQKGNVPETYRGGHTIMSFLHQSFIPEHQPAVLSPLCLRAQSVALLDKAGWLSSAASIDSSAHADFFNEHDILIEKFILHLPLLDSLSTLEDTQLIRHLVITHMIARLAAMQLHTVFADTNLTSTIKCLSASKAIGAAFKVILPKRSDILRGVQLYADPYLLVCLTAAAQMMVNDLSKAKNKHILWQAGPLCNSHTYMGVVLNEFMETMDEANRGSPLTLLQVAKITTARATEGV
ncbi:hypothetical protein EIP91_012022 [Steccherinum ochraceum]|uniref:Zn(2)-C6 fungal-type domain-containing protein n=1 Tax=Steccherinum ochraceum TaxID=92696 RepID=A0A4R0RL95_9APHY|nr:hypothetical protein EIP91_012022 [Steccherinum ochraceum]